MGIIYQNGYPVPIITRDNTNYTQTTSSLHELYKNNSGVYGRAYKPALIAKVGDYGSTRFVDYLQPSFDYPLGVCTYYSGLDVISGASYVGSPTWYVQRSTTGSNIASGYVMKPKTQLGLTGSNVPDLVVGFENGDTTKIKSANYSYVDDGLSVKNLDGSDKMWWRNSNGDLVQVGSGTMTFFQVSVGFNTKLNFHTDLIVGCRNCEPTRLMIPTLTSARSAPTMNMDSAYTKTLYLGKDKDCSYYWLTTDGEITEPHVESGLTGYIPRALFGLKYKTEYSGTAGDEIFCIPFYVQNSISTRVAKKYNSTGINT